MLDPNNAYALGQVGPEQLDELRKALSIGYTMPPTGSDVLRVESLEATLKLLTYEMEDIRLWADIPKVGATSTIEEFNRLVNYGRNSSGFVAAGVKPPEDDAEYNRDSEKVKYMGTTRVVDHPTTLISTVPPDSVARETLNGALWLMGRVNTALYYADEDVIPLSWNSFPKQIIEGGGHVMDLRGQVLQKSNIEEAAYLVTENYGRAGNLYSNQKVFADISDQYNAMQRFTNPGTAGMVGTPVTGISTASGDVMFRRDHFVTSGEQKPNAGVPDGPGKPTFTANAAAGTSGSKFVAADAGDYIYSVAAITAEGLSEGADNSAAVTVAAGGSVALVITSTGTKNETGYRIYRTPKGGTTPVAIKDIPRRRNNAGVLQDTTNFSDLNEDLPNTYIGIMMDMSPQSINFKQLSPMIRMPLAVIAPSIRWMQLLYGTPIVYNAKKNVVIKNIRG